MREVQPNGPPVTSRRALLSGLAAMAAYATVSTAIARDRAAESSALERLESLPVPQRRILIRDATVLSMDKAVGDHNKADILIEGRRIAQVRPGLAKEVSGALEIDASNMIAIPGFVDAHRHAWSGQLRGLIPDANIAEYIAATHRGFAPFYRASDVYAGNLLTSVAAIESGITCVIDNSHNSRSEAHSDAAVKALMDSGIRGVHAVGAPTFGNWDKQFPADTVRLQKKYFSSHDQLLTLRLYQLGFKREVLDMAKQLDLWVTTEGLNPQQWPVLEEWDRAGLIDEKNTFNHMFGSVPQSAWEIIKNRGISVNVCPRSDAQYGLGRGIGGLQVALDNGIRPGLSVDNEASYGTDMFTEMRVGFFMQRAVAQMRKSDGDTSAPTPVSVRDMLEFATLRGAWCAGLLSHTGSLTPGKQADIVLIRGDSLNMAPMANAAAAVVSYAGTQNVDSVFISGEVRKFSGQMRMPRQAPSVEQVKQLAIASRDYLFEQRGHSKDIVR